MDNNFKEQIRQKLTEKEQRLIDELEEVTGNKVVGAPTQANFPNYGDDEDENSAEVATFTTNLSLGQELRKALRDVQGALKRLEDGDYGICKYCHQEIDQRRLLARPSSSACINCKEEMKSRV